MKTVIEVNGLNKCFADKQALNNVEFTIEHGAPVALVGPNGAGKTTLFSILCGYLLPDSGSVSILGSAPGSKALFGKVAALPQDAQFDPRFSINQQLKFYAQLQGLSRKQSTIEAERVLNNVGLTEVLHAKADELSHGMRKRVAIAQTLIGSPEIILLDEATAGLDPKHARDVRSLVAELSDNVTFILSSHDLSELERLCTQVLYLEQGKLQQHQTSLGSDIHSYITLRMKQQQPELINTLLTLPFITDVKLTQDREYLITTVNKNAEGESLALPADIEVLTLCHQNKWQYMQLINGKTLENQLF